MLKIFQLPVNNPVWRRNVVRIIVGTTALTVGLLGYRGYQVARASLLADLEANAFLEVKSSVREVDSWLGRRKAEMATIANTPTAQSLDWDLLQPYLQQEVERMRDFHLLALIDTRGRLYTNQGKTGDVRDREYFRQAMQGRLYVSDPIVSRSTGVLQVAIAAPIQGGATEAVQGAIAGAIPLDRLTEVVEALSYGPGSYAFALSSEGVPIVQPPDWPESDSALGTSLIERSDPAWRALAQKMTSGQANIERFDLDGQPSYVAYFPLRQADWSIALAIPRRNIEAALRPLDGLALTIVGLAIALLLILWRVQSWEQHHLQRAKQAADAAAADLAAALGELRRTQAQLVQSEKMSSLGQLVAGIAHEFNNPVNFIHANLTHAQTYFNDLLDLIQLYQDHLEPPPEAIAERLEALDWDFLQADLPHLLTSMRTGTERIRQLVASLRTFSRLDESGLKPTNLHDNLESTLVMLSERLRSQPHRREITVTRDYGDLPLVECDPGAINQVFLQVLSNAIDAIDARVQRDKSNAPAPAITIRTKSLGRDRVQISIADNGVGIPVAIRDRLFDPFFTTKPIGQGTGLGLALSYQAVVSHHGGSLHFKSQLGRGTVFAIRLPRRAGRPVVAIAA